MIKQFKIKYWPKLGLWLGLIPFGALAGGAPSAVPQIGWDMTNEVHHIENLVVTGEQLTQQAIMISNQMTELEDLARQGRDFYEFMWQDSTDLMRDL